jgi:hypothetical protein
VAGKVARWLLPCCPTTARPGISHSLGLPDLPDLFWNRETSSSCGEGRRLGDTPATASFARLVGQIGQVGQLNEINVLESTQVEQQVGHCPTCPPGLD